MLQKKYQKLQFKNMLAAKNLYEVLKSQKVMSYETMAETYVISTYCRRTGSFNNLIKTTLNFMYDHDLMTKEIINGLIVYVATQKCFRTKNFENATTEYQEITNSQIDEAIKYVNINCGLIPLKSEGEVIAKVIFELEGNFAKMFIEHYPTFVPRCGLPKKYQVLGTIRFLQELRILKKVN